MRRTICMGKRLPDVRDNCHSRMISNLSVVLVLFLKLILQSNIVYNVLTALDYCVVNNSTNSCMRCSVENKEYLRRNGSHDTIPASLCTSIDIVKPEHSNISAIADKPRDAMACRLT